MANIDDIEINVWDKRRWWQGRIGSPKAVTGSFMRHAPGSFQFTLSRNDDMLDEIFRKGARVGITYRGVDEFSGMRRQMSGKLTDTGDVQFQVQGDRRILENTLAWINPDAPIAPTSLDGTTIAGRAQANLARGEDLVPGAPGTVQNQTGYVSWEDWSDTLGGAAGSAEAAIKWLCRKNLVERMSRPVVIAPDQGRGGDVFGMLPNIRMSSLSEGIQPILDASGLMLQVVQHPGDEFLTLDVTASEAWGPELSATSGIVADGDWSFAPPNITRAILGGPGDIAARAFWEVRDRTGLEDEYGDVIEVFRDATSGNLQWPTTLTDPYKVAKYYLLRSDVAQADKDTFRNYLNQAGADGLLAGLPNTSVNAKLSEQGEFRYGGEDGVRLNMWMDIKAASGQVFSDVTTEAELNLSSSGFEVTPVLGSIKNDPTRKLAEKILQLGQAQRTMQRSR